MAVFKDLVIDVSVVNGIDGMKYPELAGRVKIMEMRPPKAPNDEETYVIRRLAEMESRLERNRHKEMVAARGRSGRISMLALFISLAAMAIALDWAWVLSEIGFVALE